MSNFEQSCNGQKLQDIYLNKINIPEDTEFKTLNNFTIIAAANH
jgi:hypothetical protein